MGAWGDGLFENDGDFDTSGDMSHDAGFQLYNYETEYELDEDDVPAKGLEGTRDLLNGGVFSRLFKQYTTDGLDAISPFTARPIILAVCAMRVGATIKPGEMKVLRRYSKTRFWGQDQFQKAVKYYKNDGTPYNFDSEGLLVKVAKSTGTAELERCGAPGCAKYSGQLPEGEKLQICGRCKKVCYCNADCQKLDWPSHKKVCKAPELNAQ